MLSYDQAPVQYGAVSVPDGTILPSGAAGDTMTSHVSSSTRNAAVPHHRHIWIITGPAGCGKSTVAKYLAENLSLPYIEGDEYHTPASIQKMAAGIPLTDADRWDWLARLRQEALIKLEAGNTGVVLTCSALKESYRDVIRKASANNAEVLVHFVYLKASEELLLARVKARKNHYMKDDMVHSQFLSLEEPTARETDVISVDVSRTMAEVQALALDAVRRIMTT